MNTSLDSTLGILCDKLSAEFGSGLKYYSEAVRSLSNNSAANYITSDYSEPCSVNDTYNQTIFLVRESASPATQTGGGRSKTLSRTVDFRLVANTKYIYDEYKVVIIINNLQKASYNSSSFEQDTVARTYFGLSERNTDSAFFTISFSVLETINCTPCK